MDIRRLQILRELGDRGSVVATAAAMKVTASAVSQQLKVLQEEVGVTLVEKAGRGVRLTEAGLAKGGGRLGRVCSHGAAAGHRGRLPQRLAEPAPGGILSQRGGNVPAGPDVPA